MSEKPRLLKVAANKFIRHDVSIYNSSQMFQLNVEGLALVQTFLSKGPNPDDVPYYISFLAENDNEYTEEEFQGLSAQEAYDKYFKRK